MRRPVLVVTGTLLLLGCGGPSGPTYEFGPSAAPLSYVITSHGNLSVETPMGEQRSVDSTHATIAIDIGAATDAGHAVTVAFEWLELWEGGDMNVQHAEGGELIGLPFTGTLASTGHIMVDQQPEIPGAVTRMANPVDIFSDMLPPLPPGGMLTAESWPHNTVSKSDITMTVETRYEGTARFAGDTTWNGVAAKIIVSEGTTPTSAKGTPPGAPGEIEMQQTGSSKTVYVWDPQRGVMLASLSTLEAEGDVEVPSMQMSFPVVYEGKQETRLQM